MAYSLDRAGFDTLVRTHGGELHHYCMGLTRGQRALADDVVQYTFEVAWSRRSTFDGDNGRAWLFAIARRQCLYRLRSEGRFVQVGPEKLQRLLGSQGPPDIGIEGPERERMNACFQTLKADDKSIVQVAYGLRALPDGLCKGESPTYGEIGALLTQEVGGKWSPDKVRMRLKRALAALLVCMSEGGFRRHD